MLTALEVIQDFILNPYVMQNLPRVPSAIWIALAICSFAIQGFSQTKTFKPRHFYGEKFELKDKVIHGLGQGLGQTRVNHAKDYKGMFASTKQPLIYNTYKQIVDIADDAAQFTRDINELTTNGKYMAVMISISWRNSYPTMPTTAEFNAVADALKGLDRPIFLRIEFEYNGSGVCPKWKCYSDSEVKDFYTNMADALERRSVTNVARVWTIAAERGSLNNAMRFYPGDEYVDWFGIDIFEKDEFDNPLVKGLVAEAERRKKPVFLPELSPRYVGVNQASDWNDYFVQLFDFIRDNESVKGFNYIHHPWEDENDRWKGWKNSKISDGNATLRSNYITELNQSWFYHSSSQTNVWNTLNPYPPYINPDKWYIIESHKDGRYVANKASIGDAVAGTPKLTASRKWRFEASSVGGFYSIISERDGKYLAHRDSDNDVVMWKAIDYASRRWRLERSTVGGYYLIINEEEGLYLANRTVENNVVASSPKDNYSQRWKLVPVGDVSSRVASSKSRPTIEEENWQDSEVRFFPNPATQQLSVYYPGEQAEVTFMNLQGQKLRTVKSRGGTAVIEITDLPAGMIILRVHAEEGWQQRKLVIK